MDSSNYDDAYLDEKVRVDFSENDEEYATCHRCKGSGLVFVYDQESDCIACEGMGSTLIEAPTRRFK